MQKHSNSKQKTMLPYDYRCASIGIELCKDFCFQRSQFQTFPYVFWKDEIATICT